MTKQEAIKAINTLAREGWTEPEMVRWDTGGWRVYVTDPTTGYRRHYDSVDADSLYAYRGRA